MAESDKPSTSKSYIPSFLFRRGLRGGKRSKAAARRTPALDVQKTDVVSKSVDSLLAVASSISLPPHAVLRAANPNLTALIESSASTTSGSTTSSGQAVRRHSYDVPSLQRETSEEFYDCRDGDGPDVASDGDATASSSSEASPAHRMSRRNGGRPPWDSYGRGSPGSSRIPAWKLSNIVEHARAARTAASRGGSSSRDSADSDVDDRGDADSQVFSTFGDEAATSLPGSPIIRKETRLAQVGVI
ncbi:hypothetical protein PoB_005715200 [Plakobranchus ocellatus]|uniref:Uncharacterized protein n=1 Tax=Plakobranchus ocellatus TaxID=259542 RepID=A0AAV4CH71_9GAST|nr:hypothetical protein PoB_005715200 [Plakobranchus ocellatus]